MSKIHYKPDETNARLLMCLRIIEGGCSGAQDIASSLSWSLVKANEYISRLKRKGWIAKDREHNIFTMTPEGKEGFKRLKKGC
jgi:predicted transcriptional regulator